MTALWTQLGDNDAGKAFRAMGILVGRPAEAAALLNERLHPAPTKDAPELRRLLADLDNDQFEVRERAEQALGKLGERAKGALRQVLETNSTLQVRKSVERLLEKLDRPVSDPEFFRELRAVEVLEHLGTPEARRVLEALAKGLPDARLTREAKASLERLAKRPASLH
jgi:hypothetical protein